MPCKLTNKLISIHNKYNKIYINNILKEHSISYEQYRFILSLYENNMGIPNINVDKNKINKNAIYELKQMGFVIENNNNLYLTEKGNKLQSDILNNIESQYEIILNKFYDEEKDLLINFIEKMEKNMIAHFDYKEELA